MNFQATLSRSRGIGDKMTTYKIVRSFHPAVGPVEDETVATGLTLEEARAHCKDPGTRNPGIWFDNYTAE